MIFGVGNGCGCVFGGMGFLGNFGMIIGHSGLGRRKRWFKINGKV